MSDIDMRVTDALCIRFNLDVLDVLDAASEMPERRSCADLRIYSRLAVIADCGWIDEGLVLGLQAQFLDYYEIETME